MQDGLVPVGGGKSQNGEIIITDVSCRGIVVGARARNGIAQIAFNRCDVIARYINNHTNMRIIRISVAAGRASGGIENPVAFLRCLRTLIAVTAIFTDDELQQLFMEIDAICPSAAQLYKHVVLPVMFRMIYTCGLRPTEARLLRTDNVYLESGEVLITGTKRNRDRIIVMSEDMRTLCADYNEQRRFFSPDSAFFFPGADGMAFASATVAREFCRCWKKANPDTPKENLPPVRVYDLRHRFASAAVQRWLDEGADLNAKLPFLRAYMGHSSFSQTAYYNPPFASQPHCQSSR